MGGGLMQLVAYGAQDIYLSGNPQITFFKVVYRRHTNFSMESIQQTFNGDVGFDKKVTCTISRNGDLISKMYLEIDLEPLPENYTLDANETVLTSTVNQNNLNTFYYKPGEYSRPTKDQLTLNGTSIYVQIDDLSNTSTYVDISSTNTDSLMVIGTDPSGSDTRVEITGTYTFADNSLVSNDDDGRDYVIVNNVQVYLANLDGNIYTVDEDNVTIRKTFQSFVYKDNNGNLENLENLTYGDFPVNQIMKLIDSDFTIYTNDVSNGSTVQIIDNKDEFHDVYVDVTGNNTVKYTTYESTGTTPLPFPTQEWIGHKIIDYVEVEIGGQRIDKHYGDWLAIWNELTQTEGHWNGYKQMVEGSKLYIPLQFWFNRNPGLALPLIALQYHEVKLNIKFSSKQNTYTNLRSYANGISYDAQWSEFNNGVGDMKSASLYVDYVYLDTDERRRFAQVSHEYLIEQLQFTGDENVKNKIKLNFNHPVKELVWVEKLNGDQPTGEFATSYSKANLQLNGHDRFSVREASYFQLVQPYQHHTRTPVHQDINVYSFSMKPEEHQPSGSCNMSRIDNATLYLENASNGNTIKVFAINYNVLRVMSGMGGLAYSN